MCKSFLLKSPLRLMAFAIVALIFSSCSRNATTASQWTKLDYQQAIAKQQPAEKPLENVVASEMTQFEVSTVAIPQKEVSTKVKSRVLNPVVKLTSKFAESKIVQKLEKSTNSITSVIKAPKDNPTVSKQAEGGLRYAILLGLIGIIMLILAGAVGGLAGTLLYVVGSILVVVGIIYLIMWLLNM